MLNINVSIPYENLPVSRRLKLIQKNKNIYIYIYLRWHWCLKPMKSGFARAKVSCLKILDVLLASIDAKKNPDDTLKDSKKNV